MAAFYEEEGGEIPIPNIHHLLKRCLLPSILDILETGTLC